MGTPAAAPLVSVVIPCFNLGRFLDEAVQSALAQTLPDVEVVVVDDGSTDPDTRALLADYRPPRTRVVRSENRGLPAARNLGIRSSQGPYVCALDADDRLEPTWLEKAVDVLRADPSLAFVSHWFRAFGDEQWDWTPQRCDLPSLLDSNTVNGAALVRREVLVAAGLFDESMREGCEDWELWLRVVKGGGRGAILPEMLYAYRRRPDSMSRLLMQGDAYDRPYRYLLRKHADAFREHYFELWLRGEARIAESERHASDLERDCREWLRPERERRREELVLLRGKVAELERVRAEEAGAAARLRSAEAELAGRQARIEDLERSWSWRLTAPLRALHRWLSGAGRGGAR
jgi:glycosyltransferase involved in cell wall biosynthesis